MTVCHDYVVSIQCTKCHASLENYYACKLSDTGLSVTYIRVSLHVHTILILVHNFYRLSSLQGALILLLLVIISYGHVSLKYERTTDLLSTLLFVLIRFTGKKKRQIMGEERDMERDMGRGERKNVCERV